MKKLIAKLSSTIWKAITLGKPNRGNTISAGVWILEQQGSKFAKVIRICIDWLASFWEKEHCKTVYNLEKSDSQARK